MVETTALREWKLDKGIAPGKAGEIAKFRAEQTENMQSLD